MKLDKDSMLYYYLMSLIGLTIGTAAACWLYLGTSLGDFMPPGFKVFFAVVTYAAGLVWIWHIRPSHLRKDARGTPPAPPPAAPRT